MSKLNNTNTGMKINAKVASEATLWEQYGKQILIGVVAIALCYGAMQYYRHYQATQAEKASVIYDNLLATVKGRDIAKAKTDAEMLTKQYARTPYGPLAALLLAKFSVEENKLDQASENLKLAMQLDSDGPVHQIARVRLARIMAARENYTEALNLLTPKKIPEGYETLFEETKGDVYLLQNEKGKAREAYKAAQLAAPPGAPVVRLQLKQTDLGA